MPERTFETCRPDELQVGDIVTGNCALWSVIGFSRAGLTEMVDVECIDPQGVSAFSVGFRKQFLRNCRSGTWEREAR